jgi:hypothetical protein
MSTTATTEETVMGQVIPSRHPAVVLKSHYKAIRALLAVALVAIVALAAAVVILANDDDAKVAATPKAAEQSLPAGTRFDGGPNEGTRGITSNVAPAPGTRFDGGPDEGTRGSQSYWQQHEPRSSYQPTPNEGFKARAGGPQLIPMGPSNWVRPPPRGRHPSGGRVTDGPSSGRARRRSRRAPSPRASRA